MKLLRLISALMLISITLCNAQWTQLIVPNSTASMRCAYFKNANEGFVAGAERIRHTTNGGAVWDTTNYGIYNVYLSGCIIEGIHFVSATEGIAAGWNFWDNCEIVFKTYDGGNTWDNIKWGNANAAFGTYLHDMTFVNATSGICVGDLGHIITTNNAGDTWSYNNSGTTNNLLGVAFQGTTGWVVGDQIILKTTNMGVSWSSQNFTGEYFKDVYFTGANVGYAVGNHIYKTTDGGTTWNQIQTSLSLDCNDVWAANADTIYVANSGNLLKSNDAGATWFAQQTTPVGKNYLGVYFLNQTFGIATDYDGHVYKTTTCGDAVQQNDAGVVAIPQLPYGSCQGNYPVQIAIKNYGKANLIQASINWKVKGVLQTPYVWSGNLAHDSTSSLFSIGNYNFGFGISDIVAYSTQANSVGDYIHYNDTANTSYNFPRLSGNYTVGGTNPDFVDVTAAVNSLNSFGTCGNVNFKIRNGTYTNYYVINNFYRTSITDNVVFESESGDSSLVHLNSGGVTFTLSNSKNVTFNKLSIKSTVANTVIQLSDTTNNITITNCEIEVTGTGGNGISHTGKTCSTIVITNNKIKNGNTGVSLVASTNIPVWGVTISNNIFINQYSGGISLNRVGNIIMNNNNITPITSQQNNAITIQSCYSNFVIASNKLICDKGFNILNIVNTIDTLGLKGKVINNFISCNGHLNGNTRAVSVSNSRDIEFYYNTVNAKNDYAIYLEYSDTTIAPNLTFKNNIIYNRNPGYLFYIYNSVAPNNGWYAKIFNTINHNAYNNTGGPYFGFITNYKYAIDFAGWQSAFPSDSNSVYTNPQLISNTDFHILPNTTNYLLNKNATPITGITTDADGDIRSASTPDIGCDEFTTANVDASALRFLLTDNICSGANDVFAKISNYGNNALTSVTINWSVNNITQTGYVWIGNLSGGDSSVYLLLGNYNFIAGNVYSIKAWTTNPNGTTDGVNLNDTISYTVTAKGLSGIKTIGGASPDYATFTAATAALVANGVCGAVTFKVRPGTYNEYITIPHVSGSSSINTITFESENGDSTSVLLYFNAQPKITLDSVEYVTIRKISIGTLTTSSTGIALADKCNHVEISNCVFVNAPITSSTIPVSDISIHNNRFYQSSVTVGYLSSSQPISKNIFIDNNQLKYGSLILNFAGDCSVSGNRIDSMGGSNPAINIASTEGSVIVNGNYINGNGLTFGIKVGNCNGHFDHKILVTNNMVRSDNNGYACYYTTQSTNASVLYNSGLVENTSVSYNTVFSGFFTGEMYNNCFYNKAGGTAAYFQTLTDLKADYNNYYSTGALVSSLYGDLNFLADWQALSGKDPHSLNVNPGYNSSSDLHIINNYYLDDAGISLNDITNDFDGTFRSSTPDIGANEFTITPVANDAGVRSIYHSAVTCSGTNAVKVQLKNYGNNNLTTAIIHWSVNGVAQTNYSWNGTLIPGDTSAFFNIGNYIFNAAVPANIIAWTSNPNSAADIVTANDSSSLVNLHTKLNGVYTLGGTNPDFISFDAAFNALKNYGICGPVTFNIRNGIYSGPQNVINKIDGSSIINTITFQSENADSSLVTINNGAFGNPTFNLNDADYFVFKQLTITGTSSTYFPMSLDNGSSNCKIQNCVISGGRIQIYNGCNSNLVENNYMNDQIFLSGSSGNPGVGNTVRGNTIISNNGIVSQFEDSLLIEKNVIQNPQAFISGGNYGINLLANGSHFKCIKNRISGNFSAGINLTQDGTPTEQGLVANNIVTGGNIGGHGIYVSCNYVNIVYNTFYIPAGSGGNPCQNTSGSFALGVVIKNNQFVTEDYAWSYYWGQLSGISDYNNYFTNGPVLINILVTTDYPDLVSFQTAHPTVDVHSTNVNPLFPNSSFLYPGNPLAQGTGTPIAGVTDDINDSLRSTTNPNMGAIEVPPVVVHDSLKKDIITTLLNDTVVIGNNTISVKVLNARPFTTDTALTIFEGVIDTLYFSYSVNGSTPVNETWTGSLALYDSITFNFVQQYNVPKGKLYHVHVEVQMPNKFTVIDYTNDTLTKDLMSPMIGTYTVKGTNPDFADLGEAINSLYYVPLSGNVIFNSRAGLDSMWSLNNMYLPYFITFQSESGNAADVQLIFSNINNCQKINFKNVTIYPKTNTDYLYNYKGAELIGSQLSIDSCIIRGLNDPLFRNGITFVNTDSLSVTNCHFVDLDNGITLSDYQWFGTNYFYGNNYIMNNTFDSVTNCVRILGYLLGDSTYVGNNKMNKPVLGLEFGPYGTGGKFVMEKNKITEASSYSLFVGAAFAFVTNGFDINNNMLGGAVQINNLQTFSMSFDYNSVLGYMEVFDCQEVHMRNNSIYSPTTARALFYSQSLPFGTTYDCDNNNYYAPNANELAVIFINGGGNGYAYNIADLITLTGAENNSISANPLYVSATDLHSNSPLLDNAGAPIATITTDIDDEPRSVTTPDIGCDEFNVADSLVWPGDCNYDGVANNYDLLSIGLYFNQSGTTRASASNNWTGQASADWGTLQYCGFDKKHADSNGDGIISWSDSTAIKLNWGQTHPLKPAPLPYINTQPDLHFVSSANAYKPGDTVDVEIWVGDIGNPVAALYGISFDVAFPSSMVKAGSVTLTYNPSWVGVENATAITVANIGATAAGSIVRNTGTDTAGYGMFAKLHFIIEPTLTTVTEFNLSFSNYLAVTANGNSVLFNTISDTLTIDPALSIEENASQHFFSLYPNPTTDETTISYTLQSSSQIKIELFNAIGENISVMKNEKQQAGNHQLGLKNLTSLSKGIYFIKLMVDGKVYLKKLVVE